MLLKGKSIAPGVGQGTVSVWENGVTLTSMLNYPAAFSMNDEIERLRAAFGRAVAQLKLLQRRVRGHISASDSAIFLAHATVLSDPTLMAKMEQHIMEDNLAAEAGVARTIAEMQERLSNSEVSYLNDRAADVVDLGCRLLKCLGTAAEQEVGQDDIIIADSVTPSDLVRFARNGVVAVVTEYCGFKSHVAILARGLGMPFVAGISAAAKVIPSGVKVLVDATEGLVLFQPRAEEKNVETAILRRLGQRPMFCEQAPPEPVTQDGDRIEVFLNISDPAEAEAVSRLHADGVGLYRTEFFYVGRSWWPSEEESFRAYSQVAACLGGREFDIRLADFGVEKSPPYAEIPANRNPSLGIRGVRLLLQREDILRPQVKAIAQVARHYPVCVLLPMVDTPDTLAKVVEKICTYCGSRTRGSLPFRLSAMIEVPSAVMMIDEFVNQVDAFSLGLNDLTQYTLAADRDDEFMEEYHDPLQPAVLRMVHQGFSAAQKHNKPVTMCGELAGNPKLALALLALGARRFSVSQTHYAVVVKLICSVRLADLQSMSPELLRQTSGAAVHQLLDQVVARDVQTER